MAGHREKGGIVKRILIIAMMLGFVGCVDKDKVSDAMDEFIDECKPGCTLTQKVTVTAYWAKVSATCSCPITE